MDNGEHTYVERRECVRCGERFVPARSDARYCSNRCRVAAHRERYRARASRDATWIEDGLVCVSDGLDEEQARNELEKLRAEIAERKVKMAALIAYWRDPDSRDGSPHQVMDSLGPCLPSKAVWEGKPAYANLAEYPLDGGGPIRVGAEEDAEGVIYTLLDSGHSDAWERFAARRGLRPVEDA
jgi:hypothetical protein